MRASPIYYIAPSSISITPNANGSANDLAVYVTRGAKIKVYDPRIAQLGMYNSTYQEWTISGRNRRINVDNADKPHTIYARLQKSGEKTGYLVFAAQIQEVQDGPWKEKYILSPNTSPSGSVTLKGADGKDYTWGPIPAAQATNHRTDYWWIKLGTISAPDENGQRTVDLDTGILGTDQYNSQWRLNPDDLPDKDVRYLTEDRGQWTSIPRVAYTGPSGQRTPDGTLDAAVAASLGWTGEEPLVFTQGQEIDEPYHFRHLTRLRWITQRLTEDNDSLTDADLYTKLTGTTKGWEPENTLETSRAWNYGALWECLVDGTAQEPTFGCTEWMMISGGTFSLGFFSDEEDPVPIIGLSVRPGHVDETVVPYLLFGQEDISYMVTSWRWERESNKPDLDEAWNNSARVIPDDPTSPKKSETRKLHITVDDLPDGWYVNGGRVGFKCSAVFMSDGEDTEIINRITIA